MTKEGLKECKFEVVTHLRECTCYCAEVEFESITVSFMGSVLPPLKVVCQYCGRVLYTSGLCLGKENGQ